MIKVMLADGVVDDKERALIDGYAAARNIPTAQIDLLVDGIQAGSLETPMPPSKVEAESWLEEMATMALADGFVSKEEKQAMMTLGQALDFSAFDIKQLILRTRTRLYQESKRTIRDLKKG
jgi:uncharacterized membrane protein YebE (DUF533 family)